MRRVCAVLLLLAIGFSARAELRHFYRIDDHVCRGKQPRKEDFAELARMGFKTVLDLRGGRFHKPWERKLVEAAGMHYISVRLSGIFPPKDWQMAEILSILEDPARAPIFVHCRRGDDRLGEVMACYRIAHYGWTNQRALQEASRVGLNRFEILMKRYIRHFDPSRLRGAPGRAPAPSGLRRREQPLPRASRFAEMIFHRVRQEHFRRAASSAGLAAVGRFSLRPAPVPHDRLRGSVPEVCAPAVSARAAPPGP